MQLGLHYDPTHASLGLLPVTVGIIAGAGGAMGLIAKLGRYLVLLGLLTTSAAAAAALLVVSPSGVDVPWWQLSLVLTVIGTGVGLCFGTIFDTALGDVDADKAGAASGSMSAVQQIAAAIGSASVTSVYFSTVKGSGQAHAMTTSLYVVLAITALSIGAVKLPAPPRRRAAALTHRPTPPGSSREPPGGGSREGRASASSHGRDTRAAGATRAALSRASVAQRMPRSSSRAAIPRR